MRDNEQLIATFKDVAQTNEAAIFLEVNNLTQGKNYRRETHLGNIMPCYDWEIIGPQETNDAKEIGRTVHVIARLKAALDVQALKHSSGYDIFGLHDRIAILGALNAERRTLESQLNTKVTETVLPKVPSFRRQLEQGIATAMQPATAQNAE